MLLVQRHVEGIFFGLPKGCKTAKLTSVERAREDEKRFPKVMQWVPKSSSIGSHTLSTFCLNPLAQCRSAMAETKTSLYVLCWDP